MPDFALDHQKPLAVDADVVICQSNCAAVRIGPLENDARRRQRRFGRRCDRDRHHLVPVAIEQLSAGVIPEWRGSAARRYRPAALGTSKATEVHFKLTGLVRHVRQPATVWRKLRAPLEVWTRDERTWCSIAGERDHIDVDDTLGSASCGRQCCTVR